MMSAAFIAELLEPATSALVGFRFFAIQNLADAQDGAARPVFGLGRDLIVGTHPGEGFQYLGGSRLRLQDFEEHGIVHRAHDIHDLLSGRWLRFRFHRPSPLCSGLRSRCLSWRQMVLAEWGYRTCLRSLG